MNKPEFIMLLKQYKENKAKLKIKLKRLDVLRTELKNKEELNIIVSSTDYQINRNIHSKNKISDIVGNTVAKIEDKKKELKIEIEQLEEKIRELREKIEIVEDRLEILTYKEKTLLTSYYIEECSYFDIGNRVYSNIYNETRSDETIKKIIDKALKK